MENYKIHYTDETKDVVLDVVKNFSNDIIIDNVSDDGVGITIESDEAELLYQELLEEISRRVNIPKGNTYA